MVNYNYLLLCDLFAQPVRFKTKFLTGGIRYFYGSWFGLTLSFSSILILFSYLGYISQEMFENKLDKIEANEILNEKFLTLSMKDFNFLPSIHIDHFSYIFNLGIDLFEEEAGDNQMLSKASGLFSSLTTGMEVKHTGNIDMNKLNQYVVFNMNIRQISEKGKENQIV